jgi:response regulator RpfG family c-di-GMP phosphodiesterase
MTRPAPTRPSRPKVLYVDDQIGNLTVFRACLRRFAEVRTASSGAEALEILAEEHFPIIISDQRMDGMSGSELLAEVRRLYPDTVRMLLTAHTDFNAVVEAVNQGRIARFVGKPWKREEMQAILADAHELYWSAHERKVLREESEALEPYARLGHRTVEELPGLQSDSEEIALVGVLDEQQAAVDPGVLARVAEAARRLRATVVKLAESAPDLDEAVAAR